MTDTATHNTARAQPGLTDDQAAFITGFCDAAIFTAIVTIDDEPMFLTDAFFLGQETYTDILITQLRNNEAIVKDCLKFFHDNYDTMKKLIDDGLCPDWEHHGHDFLLTRDHHGAGFWDRGYDKYGDQLTDNAEKYSENCLNFWIEPGSDPLTISYDYH